jgi:hypothetical protein
MGYVFGAAVYPVDGFAQVEREVTKEASHGYRCRVAATPSRTSSKT